MPEDKNSYTLVFTLSDKIGAPDEPLKLLKESQVNMTHIESRPSKTFQWDYDFFVEFEAETSNFDKIIPNLMKIPQVKDIRIVESGPKKSKDG